MRFVRHIDRLKKRDAAVCDVWSLLYNYTTIQLYSLMLCFECMSIQKTVVRSVLL